jgi:hypothetical protein
MLYFILRIEVIQCSSLIWTRIDFRFIKDLKIERYSLYSNPARAVFFFSLKLGPSGSLFIFLCVVQLACYIGIAPLPFPFYFSPCVRPTPANPLPVTQPVFPTHHAPPDGPAAAQGRHHCSPCSTGAQGRRKHRKIFPYGIEENSNGIMFESC